MGGNYFNSISQMFSGRISEKHSQSLVEAQLRKELDVL